jgi:hypothetical protein
VELYATVEGAAVLVLAPACSLVGTGVSIPSGKVIVDSFTVEVEVGSPSGCTRHAGDYVVAVRAVDVHCGGI